MRIPSRPDDKAYLNHVTDSNRLTFSEKKETPIFKTKFTESEIRGFSPCFFEIAVRVEEDE
ncbi:hypothetical protein [Listeria fleischmannii]|uniref:Uncharacterized protein n=1 Tax=Listeria fleischmannii FSL S10-1203 TaxID=1265822 RepID=W7DDQ2_9LIST|nr:hypothetical protein MCOL2_18414 [Listeria fleischmannii FSL S10-1203]